MIIGLWIALIGVLLAILTETLVFWKRRGALRAKEQCFKFHDFRDRLQVLAIEHKIEPGSDLYRFLLMTTNIAIRNAGLIKLSELLNIARSVKRQVDGNEFSKIQGEMKNYPKDVQALASEIFESFAWMLVSNDDVSVWLFKGLKILTKVANEAAIKCVKFVASKIAPTHVAVVREANDFDRLGQRLARSY